MQTSSEQELTKIEAIVRDTLKHKSLND